MSAEPFDLGKWLIETADRLTETDTTVRLAVVEEGERLPPDSTILPDDLNLLLESSPNHQDRYRVKQDSGNLKGHHWHQFEFVDAGENQSLGEDNATPLLITELQADTVGKQLPWSNVDRLVLTGNQLSSLANHSSVESVAANRVAGLDTQAAALERFLETENSDWGLAERTGVILQGPPGTGKTELVMELCQEKYGRIPVTISGPEVLSKWVGESERILRQKFREARNSDHGVLYIDELDAIARSREDVTQEHSAQIVAQLLVLLDGVQAKREADEDRPLRVVTSTNLMQVIDPALRRPGRLGSRPISFPRPTPDQRRAIFHHYLEQIYASTNGRLDETLQRVVTDFEFEILDDVVDGTEGSTGADIEDLILEAVGEVQRDSDVKLTKSLLKEVYTSEFTAGMTGADEQVFAVDDHGGTLSITRDTKILEVTEVSKRTDNFETYLEDLAKRYARTCCPDAKEVVLRIVQPVDLLEATRQAVRDNTIEVFQHDDGPFCLYLDEVESLARTQSQSPLVQTIRETIHEQLLTWREENILVCQQVGNDVPEFLHFPREQV